MKAWFWAAWRFDLILSQPITGLMRSTPSALALSTDRDFEIIVMMTLGRQTVVRRELRSAPGRREHVWHEDKGFVSKSEIAIRVSDGSYCIFLDGDCLARSASWRRIGRGAAGLVCHRQPFVALKVS